MPLVRRFLLVAVCTAVAIAIDSPWTTLPFDDPVGHLRSLRPEDAVASVLRLLIVGFGCVQVAVLVSVGVGDRIGDGSLGRWMRRLLVPALRSAAPLVVVAGSALPAGASTGLVPPVPPPATAGIASTTQPDHVVVAGGDSMWTIAAAHAPARVDPYWRAVVQLNADRFDDVDLIHPGDVVLLPPLNPGD